MVTSNSRKHHRVYRSLVALAAAGLAVAAVAETASAATITVTSNLDSGAGSLRAAILSAVSGDTIAFGSTAQGTITLTGGSIPIDTSLSIVGPGAGSLTLRGSGDRIFDIGAGSPAIDVTVSGLTFVGGRASDGGAIRTAQDVGRTLTVTGSAFRNNAADDDGGAIATLDGGLVVSGTVFNENAADGNGGAIYHDSLAPFSVSQSNFVRNAADDGGGAIEATASGTVSTTASLIADTTFEANTGGADGDGGAVNIRDDAAPLTVRGSAFLFNGTGDEDGGGISFQTADLNNAPLVVEDSLFEGNVAEDGSAIYDNADGAVTIARTLFRGNATYEGRGTVRFDSTNIDATVDDAAFIENTSGEEGGSGISFYGLTLAVNNTTMASNNSSTQSGYNSGTALFEQGTVTLDSVTITGNTAADGQGGVNVRGAATVTVRNSIIAGNFSAVAEVDCSGDLTFAGGAGTSILGDDTGCVVTGDTPTSGDAGLGPLRASSRVGGTDTTWIVPLNAGSPALDAGATSLTADQRGVARPQGLAPDIGAVEMRPAALALTLAARQNLVALGGTADVNARALNAGDFPTAAATLDFGFPSAFLTFAAPATGASCTTSAAGAKCSLDSLAGEEERLVAVSATANNAGTTSVTSTLSAAGLVTAFASLPVTIVGAIPAGATVATVAPAGGICARQIVRVRSRGGTRSLARVSCRLTLNSAGSYTFRFSRGRDKGNWSMLKGSMVAGTKLKRSRTTATVRNEKAGRKVLISALLPTQARSVPLSLRYTAPSGVVTPQTIK